MNPPEEFATEYWKMREHLNWAQSALGRGQDLAQGKTVLTEVREFYAKWHDVITDPKLRKGLEAVHQFMEEQLGPHLEQVFREHLHEVIEARKDWETGEQFLKLAVSFIKVMQHAPPELRPELEKVHREHMQKEFDPETHYREAEAEVAAAEAKFRQALAGLEVDWPERVDAALRDRLEKLDATGATAWRAELEAQSR